MPISAEHYFGGSFSLALALSGTIGWGRTRRVYRVAPTAGGKTITLKAANSTEIPYGPNILVLINVATVGGRSFTVEDAEGDFSELIDITQGCKITKYINASGADRFSIDVRDKL